MRIPTFAKYIFAFLLSFQYNAAYAQNSAALDSALKFAPNLEFQSLSVPIPVPAVEKASSKKFSLPGYVFSRTTNVSALIVKAIDNCETSVDAALYGMTLRDVAEALVRAKKRGVRVRVIMNERHAFTRPSEEIQYLIDNKIDMRTLRGIGYFGIMHNKIGIFDSRILMGGSFNWVFTADNANQENVIFTTNKYQVSGYKNYFDWMWGFTRKIKDGPAESSYPGDYFGAPPTASRSIGFNSVRLPLFSFSPRGKSEDNAIAAANAAKKSIDVAVFSFYSESIADSLIKAVKRGVKVRVLVDRVQASQAKVIKLMVDAGIKLRWARGFNKGVMHNKFAIMDKKILMTGSFNWSANAQQYNFENVMYINKKSYIDGFSEEFNTLYAPAHTPTQEELNKIAEDSKEFGGGRMDLFDGYPYEDPSIEYSF